MGPSAIERKRMLAEALLKQSSGIQDIRHPMQGFAQLAQALVGNLKEGQAQRAEDMGKNSADAMWNELSAGMGMGGAFPQAPGGERQAYAGPNGATRAPVNPNVGSTIDFARAEQAPRGDLAGGIVETAQSLGIDPIDLATAISYETAGTFDPTKRGPTTQHGQHRGLIQFGEPQAQQYGVDWSNPLGSQLGPQGAIAKYLLDTGVKPGMGLLDIYSAINAGGVGRYGASDANNGGAPGTVADKVRDQMAGHRAKALALLTNAGGQQVASADPSLIAPNNPGNIGMPGPGGETVQAQGAFPPPPIPRGADAGITNGQQLVGTGRMMTGTNGVTAPVVEPGGWTPAAPIPQGGPDASMLMRAAGNEFMNPSQRGVIEALLGQKIGGKKYDFVTGRDGSIFRADPQTGALDQVYGGKPDLPTDVQEYEYAKGQGYKGTFADFQVEQKRAGASQVNIDQKTEGAFDKKLAEKDAETYSNMSTEGMNAKADIGIIDELDVLLQGQGGAVTGLKGWAASKGIDVGEATDDLQAANALIKKLVPTQRQPGSGSMSDRDVELFTQSLPSLWNQPGGNAKIIGVMRGLAKYKAEQGRIADGVLTGEITRQDARKQLQALPNPLAEFTKAKANKPVSEMTDEELEAIINGE